MTIIDNTSSMTRVRHVVKRKILQPVRCGKIVAYVTLSTVRRLTTVSAVFSGCLHGVCCAVRSVIEWHRRGMGPNRVRVNLTHPHPARAYRIRISTVHAHGGFWEYALSFTRLAFRDQTRRRAFRYGTQ